MMKYIRTKNGIYEVNNDVYVENNEAFMRWFRNEQELEPDSLGKVTNQADTIEKLCDRFVFEYRKYDEDNNFIDRYWREYLFMWSAKDIYDNCKIKDKIIYGGIITDKGLIYVAKMNEKGEFELI